MYINTYICTQREKKQQPDQDKINRLPINTWKNCQGLIFKMHIIVKWKIYVILNNTPSYDIPLIFVLNHYMQRIPITPNCYKVFCTKNCSLFRINIILSLFLSLWLIQHYHPSSHQRILSQSNIHPAIPNRVFSIVLLRFSNRVCVLYYTIFVSIVVILYMYIHILYQGTYSPVWVW